MSNNRRRVRTIDYVALQGLQLATMAGAVTTTKTETEMETPTATSPSAPAAAEAEAEAPTSPAIKTSLLSPPVSTLPPVPPVRLRRELNVDEDAR